MHFQMADFGLRVCWAHTNVIGTSEARNTRLDMHERQMFPWGRFSFSDERLRKSHSALGFWLYNRHQKMA